MIEEKLNNLSIFSIEKNIIKLLTCKYAAKNTQKKMWVVY